MVAFTSFPKITKNLDLQTVLNIELFPTHMKSKLVVLGVAGKLIEDVVHWGGWI
jgi:hypothetical protein